MCIRDRLRTDYIDIWHVHGFDVATPLSEVADTLNGLIESGKVRYVGVSNFAAWQLTTLQHQLAPGRSLVSAQYEYSLLQRGVEREVLPASRALGLGLLAWSPLGRGVLTGKYRNNIPADSRAASPHWGGFTRSLLNDANRAVVEAVVAAAQGLGITPLDVALAWTTRHATSSITGARTAAQLRSLLANESFELPNEIVAALDDISDPTFTYPDATFLES